MHVNQVRITDKERTESWEEKVSVWKIEDIGEEKFNNWLRQMAEAICAQPDSDIKITFQRDKDGVAAVLSGSRIKSTQNASVDLNKKEALIIGYLKEHGSVTNAAAREIIHVGTTATRNLLNGLVDRGYLRAEGENRGRKYYLIRQDI